MSANMLQTIANVPLQPVHVVWYCICQIWFTLWDAFEGKHCYPISAAPFAKSMFVSGQTTFVLQSHGKVRQSKKKHFLEPNAHHLNGNLWNALLHDSGHIGEWFPKQTTYLFAKKMQTNHVHVPQ
jgi:hypothetical protein